MPLIGKQRKRPGDVINYPVSLERWLSRRPGNVIASAEVDAAGLTLVDLRTTETVVEPVLGGGVSGQTYTVTVAITTAPDGLRKEAEFTVAVQET
jgi:ribosomal protein S9